MTPSRKQAQSQGRDGAPVAWQWLSDLGVKPGEFQVETKPRLRHAMKNREWPEKQRVWACLSLATMGFNQELAVVLERGQIRPLTQTDIAAQTEIEVRNVHRAILELESEGCLRRMPVDQTRGLVKGEVQIHCYAIPRPPKKPKHQNATLESKSEYDGLPDNLAYWLRHLKFHAPTDEKLEEAKCLCQELTERREKLRALCISGDAHAGDSSEWTKTIQERAPHHLTPARQPQNDRIHKEEIKEITTTIAAAASLGGGWVEAAAAVQRFFPRTEDAFVLALAQNCQAVLRTAGTDSTLLTDRCLADAVRMAHKPGQHSAGLFLKTVPVVLTNWAKSSQPERRNIWDGF